MIRIRNLKKKYGTETVLNVEKLQIPRGECFGLVGNNGAGKTTLFRLVLDLIPSTEGTVHIAEENVQHSERWKKKVGAYLDEHMLLSYLTANEYFEFIRQLYGISSMELEERLADFELLFNEEIREKNKYIRDLSKGNIKKVGIAAAMIGDKEVVLLDEPFENLDPTSQNRLKNIITAEREYKNTTFLLSSHDLTHVTDICDRIVLLEKGRVKKDLKTDKEAMILELDSYFNI